MSRWPAIGSISWRTALGPPVVLLHGTGNSAGFFLPLLNELEGVRAMAIDLPGVGLSDPIDLPRKRYRETAVAWLDNQAHPARATEGAAHRPRAMARAACADCRDGRGLRAVTG